MSQVMDIVTKVVELLNPLSPEEKKRVMHAAMLLVGQDVEVKAGDNIDSVTGKASGNTGPRAEAWMKQNSLNKDEIEEVFHLENEGVNVIAAHLPGKGGKEQTLNAYLLTGVSNLLASGNPTINDKEARALCENMGCYSKKHHSEYLDEKGNLFTGTKKGGWTLTVPGLKASALLIKEIVNPVK